MGYGAPEAFASNDALEFLRMRPSSTADIWSLGCILLEFCSWFNRGRVHKEILLSERASWLIFSPPCTNSDSEPDAWLSEKARNAKQKLLEALGGQPDSLTKSIAESVIAPMLEPPGKQPSLNWLRGKSRTLLDGARDSLNDYKKTVRKAAFPLFSLVKPRKKGTCISSTLATDGRSDNTELLDPPPENEPDGSVVVEDEYYKDADIDPNISAAYSGYSYCLERYLKDKSDSRYLFPARGCDKMKELDKINVGNAIERFERLFISVK
jgi:serine/threonine protein kinase